MLFISHRSADKKFALGLLERARQHGYEERQLFLDSDPDAGIPAGSDWEQVIYDKLKQHRCLIVIYSTRWNEPESKWCFAELVTAKTLGKLVFPVVVEECPLDPIIGERQAVWPCREGEAAYERLWQALEQSDLGPHDTRPWPPLDEHHKPTDPCPYPGLTTFSERFAPVYFGRAPEAVEVLTELKKMRDRGEPRLLMIVGGSGSGKSSLLRAGVLPKVARNRDWIVLRTLRYGQTPNDDLTLVALLAQELSGRFPPDAHARPDWKELRAKFESDNVEQAARDFFDVTQDVNQALGCSDATTLLPIDQFEELLTTAARPSAERFLRFLRALLAKNNGRLLVIGTLRSDYLDVYERNPHALQPPYLQTYRLPPFPWERVTDVIVEPAARVGVTFTSELLERLKRDTPSSDALPLLAFTLEKLFRECSADQGITLGEYEALGGMTGAIGQAVKKIVPAGLPPETEQALRLSFVRYLVQLNEKDEFVRRTARWSDLPTAAQPILEKFINGRLLHTSGEGSGTTVEVSHEALFRCWPALVDWLNVSAQVLRWRRDVERDRKSAKESWPGLTRAQLAVSRRWPSEIPDELSREEKAWIRKAICRERLLQAAVAAVILLVTSLGAIAWYQRSVAIEQSDIAKTETEKARQKTRIATAQRLAARSDAVRIAHPQRSFLLAVEGIRATTSADEPRVAAAEESLRKSLAAVSGLSLHRTQGPPGRIAFSSNGRWLAASGVFDSRRQDPMVTLWDTTSATPEDSVKLLKSHSKLVTSLAFDSKGSRLVTGSMDGTVQVSVIGNDAVTTNVIMSDCGFITAITSSLARKWIASASQNGAVRIYDSLQGKELPALHLKAKAQPVGHGHFGPDELIGTLPAPIGSITISPDGRWLVTGCGDKTVRLWSLKETGLSDAPIILTGHTGSVDRISFSQDSRWLVTACSWYDTAVRVWDLQNVSETLEPSVLPGHDLYVEAVAFSPDQCWLATAGRDGARLWEMNSIKIGKMSPQVVLPGSAMGISTLEYLPNGKYLAGGARDGTIRLWQIPDSGQRGKETIVLRGFEGPVTDIATNADGRWLAASSYDSSVRLWNLDRLLPATDPVSLRMGAMSRDAMSVAISPNNKWLVAAFGLGGIGCWRLPPDSLRMESPVRKDHEYGVARVLLSGDNQWLLSMGWSNPAPDAKSAEKDTGPRLWRISEKGLGPAPFRLRGHTGDVTDAQFSRDARKLITTARDGARIWNLRSKDPSANPVLLPHSATECASFSPAGTWLITGDSDGNVQAWNTISTKSPPDSLAVTKHGSTVTSIVFDRRGRRFATAGGDGYVQIFRCSSARPSPEHPRKLQAGDWINSIAFSPDENWLIAVCRQQPPKLWYLPNFTDQSFELLGHGGDGGARSAIFSPDSKKVVTIGWDNFARTWDLAIPGKVAVGVALEHAENLREQTISPDGRWLVTGDVKGGVYFWRLQLDELIALARTACGRNLTRREWRQYFPEERYRRTFEDLPEPYPMKDYSIRIR